VRPARGHGATRSAAQERGDSRIADECLRGRE
jgi:hypothetical protein